MKAKNIFMILVILLAFLGIGITPAYAQTPAQIISINKPMSAELRAALDAWLISTPPSDAVYYAVTYHQFMGEYTFVSLVGLNIATPDAFWSLVGDEEGNQQVIWMDSIYVYPDGTITPISTQQQEQAGVSKLAIPELMPLPGAGGGTSVRFPWQPAKAVQYGLLGIHHAGYGTGGSWFAVDLVSGSDMGAGAASDKVYASASGSISHICDYGDTVAVRITGANDAFLYAHLLPNANLVAEQTFATGAFIGSLKHGSFVDECGNAVQQDDHWHVHWGFEMKGAGLQTFQAEGCTLKKSETYMAGTWFCGNTEIKPRGYLTHFGNISIDPEDGTVGLHTGEGEGAGGGPSFWTYLIGGIKDMFGILFLDNLPEHSSDLLKFITPIMNGVKIVFRIAQVLFRGNLNLAPAVIVISAAISLKIMINAIMFFGYIIRVIKSVPIL